MRARPCAQESGIVMPDERETPPADERPPLLVEPPVREARLRPEYSERYPGIDPGVWFTAATLSDFLAARANRHRLSPELFDRVLDPQHFEFRGGGHSALPRRGARERVTDV
jgi:hypothetical protein